MSVSSLLAHLQTHLLAPPQPPLLPTLLPLLALHQPFAAPAADPAATHKFLRTLDALVVGKDEAGRLVGWIVAAEVLEQEARGAEVVRDGGCVDRYGKGWLVMLVGLAGHKKLPESLLGPYTSLLLTLSTTAPLYPQFQRESLLPSLQKLVLALLSSFPPTQPLSPAHLEVTLPILPKLIAMHPASLRPLQTQLQTLALRALTSPATADRRTRTTAAVDLFTALPPLVGKSAMPQAFHVAVLAALESAHQGADALFEGVFDEPVRERDGEGVKFAPWDEERREKDGWKRKGTGKARIEGGVRLVVGLLRSATERAVPVPIGSILALALRLFRLTSSTPLAQAATSQDVNVTLSVLPEVHALGCALVGQLGLAVGPAMLPHMTELASHLVFLLEQTTSPLVQTTLQKTLALLFSHVGPLAPSRAVSSSLVDRLAKASLRVLGGALLPTRELSGGGEGSVEGAHGTKGKGKKRAGLDAVAGASILSTVALPLGPSVRGAVDGSIDLLDLTLSHPALPPPTHALATKVLLSIAYSLPHSSVVHGAAQMALEERVQSLLVGGVGEGPVAREGGVGPELGWVANALGTGSKMGDEVSKFLNPVLPPTHQPLPSLDSTLLYLPPGPTERGTRLELGFALESDEVRYVVSSAEGEEGDVKMDGPTDDRSVEQEPLKPSFPRVVVDDEVKPTASSAAAVGQPDPFAMPVLAPVPPPPAPTTTPAAVPALQPLPATAADPSSSLSSSTGIEIASPPPSVPVTAPTTIPAPGGWQSSAYDAAAAGGGDVEEDEEDEEMPEIDMGDDTDEEEEEE